MVNSNLERERTHLLTVLAAIDAEACTLREQGEALPNALAKRMGETHGALRKVEHQLARLRESAK